MRHVSNRGLLNLGVSATLCVVACLRSGSAVADDVAVAAGFFAAGDANPAAAMYRPVLKVELSFANRVCDLSDEQLQASMAEGKAALAKFAANPKNANVQQGVFLFNAFGQASASERPRDALEKLLQEKISATLNEEQREVYKLELRDRGLFRRRAIIGVLVGNLAQKLDLNAEQSEQIGESLEEKWSSNWAPDLEMIENYGQQYFPQVPNNIIVPHLDADQKKLWNGLQKVNFSSGGGLHLDANVIDDIDLGE